jgi:cell division protein FtsA
VQALWLEVLAGARAALTRDEKEIGSLFVDIGGGTTEFALFKNGSVASTGVLPIGGELFTSDLSIVLKTPMEDAERIKRKHGCLLESAVDDAETIEIPALGGRAPRLSSSRILCDILKPRAEELFGIIRDELKAAGLEKDFPAGIALGGGGAELDGITEVAEQVFDVSVRKATPAGVGGLVDVVASPDWTTATGLLLVGLETAAIPKPKARLTEIVKSFFRPKGGGAA